MPDDSLSFSDFLARIRAGDSSAAVELVRRYESLVRVEIRLRLTDPTLRRIVDSMDILQSVLASFFVRAAAGEYDLENPQQLVGLLVAMARKKVAMHVRKQHTQRRGSGRVSDCTTIDVEAVENGPEPYRFAQGKELLAEVTRKLTDEERFIAERRAEGMPWAEIANLIGSSGDATRKQLRRALDRVTTQLGLDDI